jgi:transposase
MNHVFDLKISQGAVDNILRRSKTSVEKSAAEILAKIRTSDAISSDETSARVRGVNEWEWVFRSQNVTLHVIRPSRGAKVVEEVLNGHVPEVWGADLYSAQRGHGKTFQICLAHQIRDCQYAIDCGDAEFAGTLKRLFQDCTRIAKRMPELKAATIKSYGYKLNDRLDKILMMTPKTVDGRKLLKRYKKERGDLFTFLSDSRIPATNNACERALRTSVIYRKVTGGFRSDWGRDLYAAIRSVVNTGLQNNLNPAQALSSAIAN